jgi:hypothetical protein
MKTAPSVLDSADPARSAHAPIFAFPSGQELAQDARAMQALAALVKKRLPSHRVRLISVVGSLPDGANERWHLLCGALLELLGSGCSLVDSAAILWFQGITALLCGSAALQAFQGQGFNLAPRPPGWSVVIQPAGPPQKPLKLLFAILTPPPVPARRQQLRWGVVAGILALTTLLPGFGLLFYGTVLCAVCFLLLKAMPYLLKPKPEASKTLETLLAFAKNGPEKLWLVASGAGEEGVLSVLDWWNLEQVELGRASGVERELKSARLLEARVIEGAG